MSKSNQEWWPERLSLDILDQNAQDASPIEGFERLGVVEPVLYRARVLRVLVEDVQTQQIGRAHV